MASGDKILLTLNYMHIATDIIIDKRQTINIDSGSIRTQSDSRKWSLKINSSNNCFRKFQDKVRDSHRMMNDGCVRIKNQCIFSQNH